MNYSQSINQRSDSVNLAESITEKITILPIENQSDIFDFIEFTPERYTQYPSEHLVHGEWSNSDFTKLSMQQSLSGIEGDPVNYTSKNTRERWL